MNASGRLGVFALSALGQVTLPRRQHQPPDATARELAGAHTPHMCIMFTITSAIGVGRGRQVCAWEGREGSGRVVLGGKMRGAKKPTAAWHARAKGTARRRPCRSLTLSRQPQMA
jgi:hypothetical protein